MTGLLEREIKDRFDIHDVMHRYARMVDRRQWELQDQVLYIDLIKLPTWARHRTTQPVAGLALL